MTRLFSYLQYRKLGFKVTSAFQLSEPNHFVDKIILGLTIFILASLSVGFIIGYLESITNQSAIQAERTSKQQLERLEKVVIGCLQNGTMSIEGVIHECRPVTLGVKL